MHVQQVDGVEVRLAEPHDLGFLSRWGRVTRVWDEQDSGNLCFALRDSQGRGRFVKYAGAATVRATDSVDQAVDRLRHAGRVMEALAGLPLVELHEVVDLPHGLALVMELVDAVPLGRQYDRVAEARAVSVASREQMVADLLDFHVRATQRGWVAVDLYDGSVLVERRPDGGARVRLCDIDVYQPAPLVNTMGRMWGSSRFMSPEEYQLGAVIDEVSTCVPLGSLAFALLGDLDERTLARWESSPAAFEVARRACDPDRDARFATLVEFAEAWAAAT